MKDMLVELKGHDKSGEGKADEKKMPLKSKDNTKEDMDKSDLTDDEKSTLKKLLDRIKR